MKKKINFQIFKRNQQRAQILKNPLQQLLYSSAYQSINDFIIDIKRPFNNICIHGFYQQMMIDYLIKHRNQFSISQLNSSTSINQPKQKPKITIVDYLNIQNNPKYQNQIFQTRIFELENNDAFIVQENQFDLVISGLELNHVNDQQNMFEKYLRTLKPDGALIGCAMVEGTLSELRWSYLMAQNQRCGGISPKILNFPSLGQLGNLLTTTHYHLATVVNKDFFLQFDTPLDVLRAIQIVGQSGQLRGRRKAVYKQLLIAMYALYQTQFQLINEQQKKNKILSSVILSPFIGWKYCPDQPKPLRRGQHGESLDFVNELRKFDPDLEHYHIREDQQQLEKINKQKNNDKKN